MSFKNSIIVLGAGVLGLTTAAELSSRFPDTKVIVVAKHLPGDRDKLYASPWAGANFEPVSRDNGPAEERDAITYRKLTELLQQGHGDEAGIYKMDCRTFYDVSPEDAGVFSDGTQAIWFDSLVEGGIRHLDSNQIPAGAKFGFDFQSFTIDTQRYLCWLQNLVLGKGVEIRRGSYSSLADLFERFPDAQTCFNCTGIGARHLGNVKDSSVYPVRGQIVLIENPREPVTRQYVRVSPQADNGGATYVFPRGKYGGIILGGCRQEDDWDGEVDMDLARDIMQRCCKLAPELGEPDNLKVIHHGVGLRPSRRNGARIERELINNKTVIHNYGAGGFGYQSSWGAAQQAVDLLSGFSRL